MDNPILRAEHQEFAKRIEEEQHRQNKRIDILEKAQAQTDDMIRVVERLATNMENMLKEQEKQGRRLEVLEERDGEKWRTVSSYVITAVIGIVLGIVATTISI